jgi:hypothetical protein
MRCSAQLGRIAEHWDVIQDVPPACADRIF